MFRAIQNGSWIEENMRDEVKKLKEKIII